jgi:hypothetical protein
MEALTIGKASQSLANAWPSSTAGTIGAGLSQSATLAPTHNDIVIPASKRQDSVAFRNVVQAYCSTGVLIALVVLTYWSTEVLARLVVQTYCNTIVLACKSTSVQAYHSTLALLKMILICSSTGVLAYRRTISGAYTTDKPGL